MHCQLSEAYLFQLVPVIAVSMTAISELHFLIDLWNYIANESNVSYFFRLV